MRDKRQMKILTLSVVGETIKLLGNSSYGYQIMDRSRHTEILYLNEEKTHKAINNRLFRRLNSVSRDIYEVEQGDRSEPQPL